MFSENEEINKTQNSYSILIMAEIELTLNFPFNKFKVPTGT